jgi:hypothetical protein
VRAVFGLHFAVELRGSVVSFNAIKKSQNCHFTTSRCIVTAFAMFGIKDNCTSKRTFAGALALIGVFIAAALWIFPTGQAPETPQSSLDKTRGGVHRLI